VRFDTVNRLPDGEVGIRISDGSVTKKGFLRVWVQKGPMQRSSGVIWAEYKANILSPCNKEVKNEWSSIYTHTGRVQV
jgi:hypothetical protein